MTVAEGFSTASVPDDAASLRRIVWSSVIGTAVEWYDFLIYGAATALVFNKVFFAAGDPALATIAAFGTYAVGFLARPLGAAIFAFAYFRFSFAQGSSHAKEVLDEEGRADGARRPARGVSWRSPIADCAGRARSFAGSRRRRSGAVAG